MLAGGMRKSEGSWTEKQSVAGYSPSLSHLDPFTAKLQQLSWHLSDFQVNNLLNVAFGFKVSSHFVARALPIVRAVIHMRPKLVFRIVCFFVSFLVFIVYLYVFSLHTNYICEWILTNYCKKQSRRSDSNFKFSSKPTVFLEPQRSHQHIGQ